MIDSENTDVYDTPVLIIGAGVTGTGIARDLALRGIRSTVVERTDLNAGASGANHGLLHSGARYIATDPHAARECREENERLRRLMPHCIEPTGGLFVAVEGDDEAYAADFPGRCEAAGIPAHPVDIREAREMAPRLGDRVTAAYRVADGTIDPFRISIDNLAQARSFGAAYLPHTRVVGFDRSGDRIRGVRLTTADGETLMLRPAMVVNAAGAWAGEIAALAGAPLNMVFSQGTLAVTARRMAHPVINRLRPPGDGDILVPGGTVSILGTTSVRIETPDRVRPTATEVDRIIAEGAAMIPDLTETRYIRAYAGVRPLVQPGGACEDRCISRGFALIDHESDGVSNLITITGGKLTTFRLMAEKTADAVCARLGVQAPCRTAQEPLPASSAGDWTEPGAGPRRWVRTKNPEDPLLCECEMVPASGVDALVREIGESGRSPGLSAVGLRSRVGKGPCQGAFCGPAITAHLYTSGAYADRRGIDELKSFVEERWRGQRPVLWGAPLAGSELLEAVYCGLMALDLHGTDRTR